VREVRLNGDPIDRCYITHDEITGGGELRFVMSARPDRTRCTEAEDWPYSMSQP